MPDAGTPMPGRENRLLFITIAVSAAVLFALAQFRFPAREVIEVPAAAPLERLAVRATYDELAAIVAQLEARIGPSLIALQLSGPPSDSPELFSTPGADHDLPWYVPALRIRPDVAVARVPPEARVRLAGGAIGSADVIVRDPLRNLAAIRVPPPPAGVGWAVDPADEIATPRYVAVAEATPGGPTLRPLFLGRTDPVADARWQQPLVALGGTLLAQTGSLIFSLDGRFVGSTVVQERGLAVVPARTLVESAERLLEGDRPPLGDVGLEVSALAPELAEATGAEQGVMVSWVDPAGPASSVARVGDVLQSVNGLRVVSPGEARVHLRRMAPGTAGHLSVVRKGHPEPLRLDVTPRPVGAEARTAPPTALGLSLRAVPAMGAEVLQVESASAGAQAGIRRGDLITHVDGAPLERPAQLTRAFADATAGEALIVGVLRDGRHIVVALNRP